MAAALWPCRTAPGHCDENLVPFQNGCFSSKRKRFAPFLRVRLIVLCMCGRQLADQGQGPGSSIALCQHDLGHAAERPCLAPRSFH